MDDVEMLETKIQNMESTRLYDRSTRPSERFLF